MPGKAEIARRRQLKKDKAKADRLMSALALLHDGRCTTCGSLSELQPGHYFHRTKGLLRWDQRNVAAQCAKCNIAHNANPEPLRRVIQRRLGDEGLATLEREAHGIGPQPDMDTICQRLSDAIEHLPRWSSLSPELRHKILRGTFTNKELLQAMGL